MIKMVKDQVEKAGNMHEQMGIFNQEIATIKRTKMEKLKLSFKNTSEIKIQWPYQKTIYNRRKDQ